MIELNNVSYAYRNTDQNVLDNISISIKNSEIFGLLGPSGAGKTTLIKLITGQIENRNSDISINHQHPSLKIIQNDVGMVMDTVGLYDRLTCWQNLEIFARIHRIPMNYINEVLEEVGLEESKNLEVYKLSAGMKQRLLLARAIIHSPRILFLDEPTKGLDPTTAEEIHKLILNIRKKGTTIFLTTHNMLEAEKLCDNIGLLYKGKIVEYGSPAKLKQKYFGDSLVQLITKKGVKKNFHTINDVENIITYFRNNDVLTIHSMEPSLEEIFIKLTGEGLNNEHD